MKSVVTAAPVLCHHRLTLLLIRGLILLQGFHLNDPSTSKSTQRGLVAQRELE